MRRSLTGTGTVALLAAMMSACNSSTEALYKQGPWGPSHIKRTYPEYDAPWGRRDGEVDRNQPATIETTRLLVLEPELLPPSRRLTELHLEPDVAPLPRANPAEPFDSGMVPAPGTVLLDGPPAGAAGLTDPTQADLPGTFTPSQRASSYAGTWKATIGPSSCRIQLSSVPSLDLYRASTRQCPNEALREVNGWTFRDNQIILYSRGQVMARLTGAEASLSGSLSSSGAEIKMTR